MIVKTVGRGQDNNIVVNDEKVSRVHLQMVQDEGGNISVVDVGSSNGTFVNGHRIVGETRLKSGDEVRIGNTVLPWQEYFQESKPPIPPMPQMSQPSMPSRPTKRNLTWLYIVGGVVLLLLISGGVMLYVHGKKKTEKERIEQQQKKDQYLRLEQEAKDAETKAAVASAEYAAAQQKAAETKSREDKKKADELLKVAQTANQAAKTANEKKKDMEQKMRDAEARATAAENKANQEVAAANAEKAEQEKAAKEAQRQAAEEKGKADSLARQTELTTDFYKQLNKAIEEDKLKEVCNALKITSASNDKERKNRIIEKFNMAKTNTARAKIVEDINNALRQTTKSTKKPNTTSSKEALPANTGSTNELSGV